MIAISIFTAKAVLFVLGCLCVLCAVLISVVKEAPNYEISNVGDEE